MSSLDDFDIAKDNDWLSPVQILELRDAVSKRQSTVVLGGKVFAVTYHDDKAKVFVKYVSDFAPAGWFTYQQLEQYEFESDHDKGL